MQHNYDLTIKNEVGTFCVHISMFKRTTSEQTSFHRGVDGRRVKLVNVLPKDPEIDRITSRSEIEKIVQYNELETLWGTGEKDESGSEKYIVVDKKVLKGAYPSTPTMEVICTLSLANVPQQRLSGTHYFVDVHRPKKGKTRTKNQEDEAMYQLLCKGLRKKQECLFVKFNSNNRPKRAIIYAKQDGLYASLLTEDNYQREREQKYEYKEKIDLELYDNLIGESRVEELPAFTDGYQKKVDKLIQAVLRGEEIPEKRVKSEPACFARLASLRKSKSV